MCPPGLSGVSGGVRRTASGEPSWSLPTEAAAMATPKRPATRTQFLRAEKVGGGGDTHALCRQGGLGRWGPRGGLDGGPHGRRRQRRLRSVPASPRCLEEPLELPAAERGDGRSSSLRGLVCYGLLWLLRAAGAGRGWQRRSGGPRMVPTRSPM